MHVLLLFQESDDLPMSESEDSLVDSAKKERQYHQHYLRDYHARIRLDSMTDSGTDTETREKDILQVRILSTVLCILILKLYNLTRFIGFT